MGNVQSTNPGPSAPVAAPPAACPVKHDAMAGRQAATVPSASGGACPVKHDAAPSSPGLPATCPVSHNKEKRDRGVVYNVYAEPIDPKNMMPANANQTVNARRLDLRHLSCSSPDACINSCSQPPASRGICLLSAFRAPSPRVALKPRGSTPPPKCFITVRSGQDSGPCLPGYLIGARPCCSSAALVRKGKAADVETKDVGMVVAIHNEMNERAWRQLIEWEALHKGCVGATLETCGG